MRSQRTLLVSDTQRGGLKVAPSRLGDARTASTEHSTIRVLLGQTSLPLGIPMRRGHGDPVSLSGLILTLFVACTSHA